MEKMMNMLMPKANPQQQLRDWQRRLRQESRNIERQIRGTTLFPLFYFLSFSLFYIQREEKSVQKAIREAAKRNDMGSAKVNPHSHLPVSIAILHEAHFILVALAKEIVMSRRCVNRLYENKAQLNSISMHLGESVAIARTVGHLSKSAEVMKLVNNLMKAPEVAITMQEFSKEMMKAGIIEETVNEAVDSALDSEDIEEEIEEEVEKVLTALAGETAAQLPEAVRKEKLKQPARVAGAEVEDEAIAEGADDEEELEEIRARLARVRS
ncbi:hypothetical protein RHGRI_036587 [Rhododendron griersonianum]|uniref:Uncharacterized protein n=1 Tax=Rhododendron griersonianum TaxID=479676 RepID=A0AAV6HNK3_9ERIC|nr:hypothetical protein RHGRI_036587 [Rhododendron griersonianum]